MAPISRNLVNLCNFSWNCYYLIYVVCLNVNNLVKRQGDPLQAMHKEWINLNCVFTRLIHIIGSSSAFQNPIQIALRLIFIQIWFGRDLMHAAKRRPYWYFLCFFSSSHIVCLLIFVVVCASAFALSLL